MGLHVGRYGWCIWTDGRLLGLVHKRSEIPWDSKRVSM